MPLSLYQRHVCLHPEDPDALCDFATAKKLLGDRKGAAAGYIRAIALKPDHALSAYNFATLFQEAGHLDVAMRAYRGAIAGRPDDASAYGNLARCREEMGLPDDAQGRALLLRPDDANALMNQVMAQLYRPGADPARILGDARRWAATQLKPRPLRSTRKTPRIGMISADFRRHAVGSLVLPAVERMTDVTLYMNSARSDEITERFRKAAFRWREVSGLSDDALARRIAADEIDILFDLSGFTAGNRLSLFARRAAPVQISWAGFPCTTGLDAIDYVLGDHHQLPVGAEAHFSEKLIRLPHSYVCFAPPSDAPPPSPLPALANGHVTFGSFNAAKKLNGEVLALWDEILRRLPSARLSLKAEAFSLPSTADRFRRFGDRVSIAGSTPPAAHQAAMAAVDIALDPFPYSGGQTTLECLWAGLPVVTWPQDTMASRHACGYLSTLGLGEWIAKDALDYVRIATELASDLPRLAAIRDGMRQRMIGSPLCDADQFVRDLEKALTEIWR